MVFICVARALARSCPFDQLTVICLPPLYPAHQPHRLMFIFHVSGAPRPHGAVVAAPARPAARCQVSVSPPPAAPVRACSSLVCARLEAPTGSARATRRQHTYTPQGCRCWWLVLHDRCSHTPSRSPSQHMHARIHALLPPIRVPPRPVACAPRVPSGHAGPVPERAALPAEITSAAPRLADNFSAEFECELPGQAQTSGWRSIQMDCMQL